MANSVGLRWYSTGKIALTANSTAVTGTGTGWNDIGIKPGDILTVDRSTFYEIAAVNSNTSITLAQSFTGTTASNLTYYIIRNFAATTAAVLGAEVTRQNAIYQTWMDGRVTEIGLKNDLSLLNKGAWKSGQSYKELDIVLYNSTLYACTVAHTSSSSILPTNVNYWCTFAPTVPAGVDCFNFNNDGVHNCMYRGKNLGSTFTAAQQNAIAAGTFEDLYIGDYWAVENLSHTYEDADGNSVTETYSGMLAIADFNYWLRCGDSDFTNFHIAVVPLRVMYNHCMNDTNITTGAYAGSKMRATGLNKARAIFNAFFGSAHVPTHRIYIENAVTNGVASGGAWVNSTGPEIMDERQVYGSLIFDAASKNSASIPSRYSVDHTQFNLFRHNKKLVTYRDYYWLRNVVSAANFALVNYYGHCYYASASNALGVRPAALIK
ncbi:MAG: hypothetical protein IJS40_05090 [Synergistaceae bacterium]|nr:hypothetical protein [Synergistaceae bacterium]